jgi:membrane protease subunit HflK
VKLLRWGVLVGVGLYLATGFVVVPGDEQVAVRWCGRFAPPLRSGGWHYVGPWPWATVDRVNIGALRTASIGVTLPMTDELLPAERPSPATFLTGDKNLVQIRATVAYRLEPTAIAAGLYRHADPSTVLEGQLIASLTEATARRGVDALQTSALTELQAELTEAIRQAVARLALGLVIEQVTVEAVDPPTAVQADFLDVSNARADAATAVQEARTAGERRVTAATAEAQRLAQAAAQTAQAQVSAARGRAARFTALVVQLEEEARRSGRPYVDCRALAERRLTLDCWRTVLPRLARPILVDRGQQLDLQLRPTPIPTPND